MNGHPQYVLKRDGRVVPFDAKKIATALAKAGAVTGEFDEAKAERLALLVLEQLPHDITPAIETIQDVVEETLLGLHHIKTARAYIAYRSQHARLRNDIRTVVDVESSINEYLDQSDWRVNANANQGWSLGGGLSRSPASGEWATVILRHIMFLTRKIITQRRVSGPEGAAKNQPERKAVPQDRS